MAKISCTAQCALDEYGRWIADVLDEQIADRKTENSSEKPNNCEEWQDWKDKMWSEAVVTEPQTEGNSDEDR